jgi:hypothetical protein
MVPAAANTSIYIFRTQESGIAAEFPVKWLVLTAGGR